MASAAMRLRLRLGRPYLSRGVRRRFSSQTDAERMATLARELPPLYDEAFLQFEPVWSHMVEAVVAANPAPRVVLDLASGPGEPACTLAQRFPGAEVVASDNEAAMCSKAQERVAGL